MNIFIFIVSSSCSSVFSILLSLFSTIFPPSFPPFPILLPSLSSP